MLMEEFKPEIMGRHEYDKWDELGLVTKFWILGIPRL